MPARFGTFTGGIDLPDDKQATLDSPIVPVRRLSRLRVPLAPLEAPPARLLVSPGQYVSHGERLAAGDGENQVDVFAPLAGRVRGAVEVMLPRNSLGWRRGPALELTELDDPIGITCARPTYDWMAADDHSIRARIREGGLITHRAPATSVARWIELARRAGADVLIANVMENTPFVTADHRLLAECGSEVARGLAILARAIGCTDVMLAVDRRRTDAYRQAVAPARLYAIDSVALSHKYPTGSDAMLTTILARRKVAPGASPLDEGVAVLDAATCWSVYRWVACGQPPLARVVTVSGPCVRAPGNCFVPWGADAAELLALAEARATELPVHGSAMNGLQLVTGAVVSSTTSALLGLNEPPAGQPTPCIRCGWCSGHCPARLNVAALNDDYELGRIGRARRRGVLACIDCGVCAYVCPARLPLARRALLLKEAVRRREQLRKASAQAPVGAGP